ncbi:arginase family protein [Natronoglycomyces albus]|uniref:Arginase family protein n=1 Tax=Natronoglycomyces albus TaxID=2811108 RepID=A0A895XUK7_9ACTN|nr:arginase family protein [Natronoglycomyces albus]
MVDAPSNLGLRPPTPHTVPGCAKAPGALRDHQLLKRLRAHDAGCLTPPRFDCSDWRPGDGVGQAESIADYTVRLSNRVRAMWEENHFPLVLGGDCSILLGNALAARHLSQERDSQIGLVFIDAHSDFRHPGNSKFVGAAAAEDLALVTGRGQPDLTDIDGLRPYFEAENVVTLGLRADDPHRVELSASGIGVRTVPQMRAEGTPRSAEWALDRLAEVEAFWVHVDSDVLDPSVMPAVDGPTPGGISHGELGQLLESLVSNPKCIGMDVTVFDPDYDPQGTYAGELVDTLVAALTGSKSLGLDRSDCDAAIAAAGRFPTSRRLL